LVKAKNTSDTHFHTALAFTVFNPAILFNGPIWGQIDVTPLVPLIAGLMAGNSKRYQYLAVPLYTIAMLTKFQMIAFAPVFGILFLRNYKSNLVGILLSAPIFALAFLPAFLADNFKQAFSLPYIGAINMFSAATMGAANLWLLVVGNLAPDNSLLFGITPDSPLASIFTVRRFGMLSFSFVCLLVALAGVKNLFISKTYQNQARLRVDMFFYATLCAVTFFTLLPGMHERYLLPAAIVALAYYAVSPTKAFYPIMLGLISAFNVTMQHGLKTYSIWPSLAWLMVGVFCYGLLEFLFGNIWLNFLRRLIFRVSSFRLFAICVFLISTAVTTNYLYQNNKIHRVTLAQNQTLLTQLPPTFTSQDWGALQINQSVAGTPLRLGKTRYAHGFGTHANSVIKFALPPNASQFSFTAGLDGAVEVANVQFSVLAGETLLWSSPVINRSNDKLGTVTVDLNDAKEITLKASNLGSAGSDHANWINPVIALHD
jgi:Gpi18-like mannosyltransferase